MKSKKNQKALFERVSYFNKDRKNYLNEDFSYTYVFVDGTKVTIPASELDTDTLILLDGLDHDEDLKDRHQKELTGDWVDPTSGYKSKPHKNKELHSGYLQDEEVPEIEINDEDDADECLVDSSLDTLLNKESKNKKSKYKEFLDTLSEEQQTLLIKHNVDGLSFDEIAKLEYKMTRKKVSRQAISNRYQKILNRARKFYGVDTFASK